MGIALTQKIDVTPSRIVGNKTREPTHILTFVLVLHKGTNPHFDTTQSCLPNASGSIPPQRLCNAISKWLNKIIKLELCVVVPPYYNDIWVKSCHILDIHIFNPPDSFQTPPTTLRWWNSPNNNLTFLASHKFSGDLCNRHCKAQLLWVGSLVHN